MTLPVRWTVYCTIVLISRFSLAQNSGSAPKQDNLYAAALYASVAQMEKEWARTEHTPEDAIHPDYHHMIVKQSEMTEKLPVKAGDYEVEVLSPRELVERYRNSRKSFPILVLHPMENEGAALTVNIKLFRFSHKRTASSYVFAGSSDVEFRYDCEKNEWVVAKVQLVRS